MTNSFLKSVALLVCAAFLGTSLVLPVARAQYAEPPSPPPGAPPSAPPGNGPPPPEYRPRYDRNQELWQLRQERDGIRKGGPIAGVVISSLFLAGGLSSMGQGAALLSEPNNPFESDANCDFDDDFSCHQQGRILLIGGAVLVVGSTLGLAFSARALRKRKERIRELDGRIRTLEAEYYRVSVGIGAPQTPVMLRF